MPENKLYPPEGLSAPVPLTLSALRDAQSSGAVLEAAALRCDAALCLHFQFGSVTARMPREEVTAPWITGAGRDIGRALPCGKAGVFHRDGPLRRRQGRAGGAAVPQAGAGGRHHGT